MRMKIASIWPARSLSAASCSVSGWKRLASLKYASFTCVSLDARGQEAVHRRERDLLEAQQRVGRQREHAIDVAERVAHHVGIVQPAHGLEDHLAGGEPLRDILVGRELRLLLEAVVAVVPDEH